MTFPGWPHPEPRGATYQRRLTQRRQAILNQGRNPATGLPFGVPGASCGSCWHAVRLEGGRRQYWKCELAGLSHSARTDIRMGWPGCTLHSTTDDGKGHAPAWVTRAPERTR